MPDLRDALSSYKEAFFDTVERFRGWVSVKKYRLKKRYRVLRDKAVKYISLSSDYVLKEFAPNILAHGVLFNVPAAFFLDFPVSAFSVVSFGFGWYIVFILLPDAIRESIPTLNVKVDN